MALRSAVIGAAVAVAVLAGIGVTGYAAMRFFGRLPSPEADTEHLANALPDGADLPPGLIGIELDEDAKEGSEDDSVCAVDAFPARAEAYVGYRSPTSLSDVGLGEHGVFAIAVSYSEADDAGRALAVATAGTLTSCWQADLGGVTLSETTGSVEGADDSRVFATEGGLASIYVSVAQKGRYFILVMTDEAEPNLTHAKQILDRL